MKRCWGFTRNLTRCQRTGEWNRFCHEHKRQPFVWLFGLVFTVVAGAIGIYSGIFSSSDIPKAARQITQQQSNSTEQIIKHQDNSTERILAELRARNQSLKDQLWQRYPYGYVLLGGREGDVVSLPVYRGDMQVTADWGTAEILLDRETKTASLLLPQPQWKSDAGPIVRINPNVARWSGRYVTGMPVPVNLVHIRNQPSMYFEVIDDKPDSPICVIGFKKDDQQNFRPAANTK